MELELVQSLIETITSLSADLWEMAMRQVWVYAGECILTLVVCVPILIIFTRLVLNKVRELKEKSERKEYWDEGNILIVTCYVLVVGFMGVFIYIALFNLIQYLINPQYAALESLLRLVQ